MEHHRVTMGEAFETWMGRGVVVRPACPKLQLRAGLSTHYERGTTTMKIYLILPDESRRNVFPFGEHFARADGTCPACGARELRIAGKNKRPSVDDRAIIAEAFAVGCCGEEIGTIRAEPDTLFGVREDAAVLNGRARVY